MKAGYIKDFQLRKVFTGVYPALCMSFFFVMTIMLFMNSSAFAQQKKTQLDDGDNFGVVIGFHKNVFLDYDLIDVNAVVEFWIQEISKETGSISTAKVYDDLDSIIRDIREEKLDLVHILPQDYLEVAKKADVELAYARVANGMKAQRYILLVHSDSKITTLEELRGKTLVFKKSDTLGMTYLNTLLLQNNLPESENFFSSVTDKDKTSRAILAVFFKSADACIAIEETYKTMIELNPQIEKNIAFLYSSPEYVNILGFFRKNYDNQLKQRIMKVMAELNNFTKGDQILKAFLTERFEAINESDISTIQDLFTTYNNLKKSPSKKVKNNGSSLINMSK